MNNEYHRIAMERGLTKIHLSRELGVSVRSIIQWEKDKISKFLKHAMELAEFFDQYLDESFKESKEKNINEKN